MARHVNRYHLAFNIDEAVEDPDHPLSRFLHPDSACCSPTIARIAAARPPPDAAHRSRLAVLRVVSPHGAEIVFDGDGRAAWDQAGPLQKNGSRSIKFRAPAADR
jgi:hypothetical protein